MVHIEDFQAADGLTDWGRYNTARVAAGELCSACRAYIVHLRSPATGPELCSDCKALQRSGAAETHASRTRCPFCQHVQPIDDELSEEDRLVGCQACDRDYVVSVRISFSYESPPVVTDEPVDAEELGIVD